MLFGQIFNNRCSICGRILIKKPKSPEDVCCRICGCTWRAQAICRAILSGLGYPEDANIRFIDSDMSRVGLGISDDWRLARAISPLFAYTNSFLHKFPVIDICFPPQEAVGKFEFISCSDVLEHTPPPRKSALEGLFQMLKPGGFVVVSVPLRRGFQFAEFYPELTTWNIEKDSVHWVDGDGRDHVEQHPEFHGGDGLTLAFRQWTEAKLIEELRAVGFSEVISRPIPLHLDSERTTCVMIARKRQD
jgi:hypothetical protein